MSNAGYICHCRLQATRKSWSLIGAGLLLMLQSMAFAKSPVDCSHPAYSRILEKEVTHGYALAEANAHGELLVAIDEDGFSDIESGTGVADRLLRIAFESSSMASRILGVWKDNELREIRLTRRSTAGYSEIELHLLEPPFLRWAFVLDAYGCSSQISEKSDVLPERRFSAEGISMSMLSGKRMHLNEALGEFRARPLMGDASASDPSLQWTYCGHGGPGTLSCTVTLPFNLGCTAYCLPGFYACCNTFGGCSCKPMGDSDDGGFPPGGPGDGGDGSGGGGGSGDGGGSGGGGDSGDDDDEEDDDEGDNENYGVSGGG